MLVSRTHFTNWTLKFHIMISMIVNILKANGGKVIGTRSSLKHDVWNKYKTDYIHATSIVIEDWKGSISINCI